MLKKIFFPVSFFIVFFYAFSVNAAVLGETKKFYLDSAYDYQNRSELPATLILQGSKINFYVENEILDSFNNGQKNEMISNLSNLSDEFEKNIYPTLTLNYGAEWNPGIDGDSKITVLFHKLKNGAGGYFNSGNEYYKLEVPASNVREMVYLDSDYIASSILKRLLAHEFTHLITFYQKEKLQNLEEEVWLNEARAEYAPTLCGYDNNYQGSNLQKRVIEFIKNPNDSIIGWQGTSSDYGALNLFIQYLVDQYGVKILNNSLHSDKKGIDSINYALKNSGFSKTFADIFSDWAIAILANNCSLGENYCFKNNNLKNLRVIPNNFTFLNSGVSVLKYNISNWSGNWQSISSKINDFSLEISGFTETDFTMAYVLCDSNAKCQVNYFNNDKKNLSFNKFDGDYIYIISVLKSDTVSNADISITITEKENSVSGNNTDSAEIKELLLKIEDLKKQIAELREKLAIINNADNQDSKCQIINDLYFGLNNNSEVVCLQKFLKNQGLDIYPEGLITGNFYTATKNAVIRFQEKYFDVIIKPLGLAKGTGYAGEMTRKKINQLILK